MPFLRSPYPPNIPWHHHTTSFCMWHVLVLQLMFSAVLAAPPLKVFILAGQSNMIGLGSLDHLNDLVGIEGSEYRQALWNESSQDYVDIDNVYVKYGDSEGKLKAGKSNGFAEYNDRFGPELMFGSTVRQALSPDDESSNILLIKTGWGGKNLAVDFRSPSAGIDTSEYGNRRPIEYGHYYRLMINDILSTLDGLESQDMIPYNKEDGYELEGFVWLHGWNDMLYRNTVEAYDKLLTKFIKDIRLDLSTPALPVVVGELGMHGRGFDIPEHAKDRILAFRAKQEAVTRRKEFRDNTIFVRLADFALQSAEDTLYDRIEHYYGRADTFYHIGKALGQGALQMMNIETDIVPVQKKGDKCDDGDGGASEDATSNSSMSEEEQPQENGKGWVYIDGYDKIAPDKEEKDDGLLESEGQQTSSEDSSMREEGQSEQEQRDWIADEWDGYDIDDHKVSEKEFEDEGQPSSSADKREEKKNIFHREGKKIYRQEIRRRKRDERNKPYLRSRIDVDSGTTTTVVIRAPPDKGFSFG